MGIEILKISDLSVVDRIAGKNEEKIVVVELEFRRHKDIKSGYNAFF